MFVEQTWLFRLSCGYMLLRHNAMMIVPFSPAVTAIQKVLIVSFASWILHLVWTARSEEFTARLNRAFCR